MKKKILLFSHTMELGGAERSLIGLLSSIDPNQYDVDLFLLHHDGELMKFIPTFVNILPEIPEYTVLARSLKKVVKEGHLVLALYRLIGKIMASLYTKRHNFTDSAVELEYSHKFTLPAMPLIQPDKEYDLAISFLTPHYFVAKKVHAKKKLAWIHTDYSKIQVNRNSELKMWDAFDYIVSISNDVTRTFLSVFPELRSKIHIIHNILPVELISCEAKQPLDIQSTKEDPLRLLSIGRFCTAKNFDNIPAICKLLRDQGVRVIWYLIGYGSDESLIREKIREAGMEKYVVLLGKKANPYPYIKACDLYVQPSRYEGKCVSVCEAQLLGKPVVITNYPTAQSQLENGVDGIIVPLDNEGCAHGIAELLQHPERMQMLSQNCLQRDYSNRSETNKLYSLI